MDNNFSRRWTSHLAYATGLMASDGNLSKDGRHLVFVSKDYQLIKTFKKCLKLKCKIGLKKSGFTPNKKYFYVQFGDKKLYDFWVSIGITPAKSKTIAELKIPDKYFFDFLRGSFDGDGSFYSYWDRRWASSFLFYLSFVSASIKHINWLRRKIKKLVGARGHFSNQLYSRTFQLKYAKNEARIIFYKMYRSKNIPKLERKFKKVQKALAVDVDNP